MGTPHTDLSPWAKLWEALGARGDAEPCHRRLLAAYAAPDRQYHNLQHIAECLGELDGARALAQHPATVEAALWFHDAVYDPRSITKEEDSAQLAVTCLTSAKVAHDTINAIRQLIFCTKTHELAGHPDAALLIDIDLAILGQPAPRFWEYEADIRAEYAWVPLATYREKRAEILTHFLQRPALYRTESFRTRYESTARANLAAAIARLKT